jgi:transporter family-2 protein
MSGVLFALIAVAVGVAGSMQGAANAGLAARIGLSATLVVNTIVVALGVLGFYAVSSPQGRFFAAGTRWSFYVGGVCGVFIIASMASIFPRIGAAVATALIVLGQGLAALAIDHWGLFEMPKEPATVTRIAGLLLIGGGVALLRS